ncbi:hypothetical protein EDF64_10172 [Curtobacterium flaccumfaciens]|uniref:Uncharacterized protein n=1 Tax=Curtobacterium flaccumfaciens TaxID=2035 RepID=A0A4R6DP20_9MICO|nr:hypothetical protein [Curtobacterium flaccumfaciens]TDN46214.1 hypothetical protein EDF64_10172 [Curtobacterium flaccumfaciens]
MTKYLVRLECVAELDDADDIATDFDAIADALFDLDDVHDQDLAADLETRTLTFSIGVVADDEFGALDRALGAVRTALHAAGRGTPGWERHYRMLRQEVEEEPVGAI